MQRSAHCQKRCVDRGTGAVNATGSWEGSLLTEGIPGQNAAQAFTSLRWRWSRRFTHPPIHTNP
jgi:hypothetical protein